MTARRWRVVALVAAIIGALGVLRVAFPAGAQTVPNGGGWAHAGAAPGSARAQSGARAEAAPAGYPGNGLDVSSHDHSTFPIDWAAVASSGVTFAYVKAAE